MSRLLSLREWVSLADGAAYLQRQLAEDVREADLIRLAMDGMLQLSVRFVNQALARCGALDGVEPQFDDVGQLAIRFAEDPEVIDGVWDILPVASGLIELERRYQRLSGGAEVTLWTAGGVYLVSPDGRTYAELTDHVVRGVTVHPEITVEGLSGKPVPLVNVARSYVAVHELPDDAELVVRPRVLEAFLVNAGSADRHASAHASQSSRIGQPRPLQRAQEDAVLAKLRELGYDPLAVPVAQPGHPSAAKQAVREALGYSDDVMKKAWQRLRTDGRIKDA